MSHAREMFIEDLRQKFLSGNGHLSYSSISKFMDSPKHFIDYKMASTQKVYEKTGSVMHEFVLFPDREPEGYETDGDIVAQIGGGNPRNTTKYKEWKASRDNTKELISIDDWNDAKYRAQCILSNDVAMGLLNQCPNREKKFTFTVRGIEIICYLDAFGGIIIDLKSCADASPRKMQRDILNLKYWMQGGVYTLAAEEVLPYYIIAADKSGGVSIHELEEELITHGMNKFDYYVSMFIDCVEKNQFHMSHEYWAPKNGVYNLPKPVWL